MDRIGPGAKLARYLRRQTDVMDFWEVEDDWPRGPYVAVYLKGDPARHRATVKRLAFFPRTRIVRVRYSDRDKERIQRRIQRDDKTLERAGFEVVRRGHQWGVDRVLVEVVTKRKDAARYFAERYGPAVKVRVYERSTVDGCARAGAYEIAPDGMSLTVRWADAAEAPRRVEVTEFAGRVAVGIVVGYSLYPGLRRPRRDHRGAAEGAARRAPGVRRLRRAAAAAVRPGARRAAVPDPRLNARRSNSWRRNASSTA